MKTIILKVAAVIISLFALVTLFMSTSVIFDLFGIREKEGNYVLFVVISNFIAGFMYLFAAYGLFTEKKWATKLLLITTTILVVSFVGLLIHANTGGIYEQKTIKAMLSRIAITAAFAGISWFFITKKRFTEMKKHVAILTVALMGIGYGCNNPVKEENSVVSKTLLSAPSKEIEHQHSESDSIELNNGAKWKVVSEMMAHIRNMESDINRFAETKHTELKDFKQLGASLQKNIDLLTSSCTMVGKAHDELHKWLLPYIDMVDNLNKSKNSDESLRTLEEIRSSYKTFNIYFE